MTQALAATKRRRSYAGASSLLPWEWGRRWFRCGGRRRFRRRRLRGRLSGRRARDPCGRESRHARVRLCGRKACREAGDGETGDGRRSETGGAPHSQGSSDEAPGVGTATFRRASACVILAVEDRHGQRRQPRHTAHEGQRLSARSTEPVRQVRPQPDRPARLPGRRGQVRGGRPHGGGVSRGAEPSLRGSAASARKSDARIKVESVEFPSPHGYGKGRGYLVLPAGDSKKTAKLPAILVVHENRGLNPHIEDVARRLALDGFMTFAPDALVPAWRLSRRRGQGTRALHEAGPGQDARRFRGRGRLPARAPAQQRQAGRRRVLLWRRRRQPSRDATARLNAAVPFYGMAPAARQGAGHQGGPAPPLRRDRRAHQRLVAGRTKRRSRQRGSNTKRSHYPGTQHGFNNDTTPRYDPAAAKLAWQRTVAFFGRTLRAH